MVLSVILGGVLLLCRALAPFLMVVIVVPVVVVVVFGYQIANLAPVPGQVVCYWVVEV